MGPPDRRRGSLFVRLHAGSVLCLRLVDRADAGRQGWHLSHLDPPHPHGRAGRCNRRGPSPVRDRQPGVTARPTGPLQAPARWAGRVRRDPGRHPRRLAGLPPQPGELLGLCGSRGSDPGPGPGAHAHWLLPQRLLLRSHLGLVVLGTFSGREPGLPPSPSDGSLGYRGPRSPFRFSRSSSWPASTGWSVSCSSPGCIAGAGSPGRCC